MALREWVREDIGLLEDDRYMGLDDVTVAAWELLYKFTARMPNEAYKSKEQMAGILRRYGRKTPEKSVRLLDEAGWFVEVEHGWQIRGWQKYQYTMRGPSDAPSIKAERNAARPTTKEGREAAAAASRAAEAKALAADMEQAQRAGAAKRRPNGKVVSFTEAMAAAGFDSTRIGRATGKPGLDGAVAPAVDSRARGD